MKEWKKRNSGDPPAPAQGPQLPALAEGDGRGEECAQVDRTPPYQFPESEEHLLQRKNFLRKPADGDGTRDGDVACAAAAAAAAADEEQEEDEEDVEDDEDYSNNLQVENGEAGAGDGEGEGEPERPKLAEGFYEIESVRRKRVRKGQVQYLIKWRGWPETENTWEPVENLMSVYDVIDSFEESLRSGKRSLRKRKRKHGSTQNQIKKKQHLNSPASASFSVPDVKVRIIEEPPSFTSHDDIGVTNHGGASVGGVTHVATRSQLNENGMNGDLISPRTEGREDQNDLDTKLSELKGATATSEENHVDKFSVHSQEAQVPGHVAVENGSAYTDCSEMFQSGRCTGSRRRKSGSVKRFKQEATFCKSDDPDITTLNSVASGLGGNQVIQRSDFSNEFGYKNKTDSPKDICDITEIIRPISYSSLMTNNMQDITVTFMAKRSDGKEVTVDNKFLKSNNPLLLINFYEQNLRYTPA